MRADGHRADAPRTLALPHGWGALAPAEFEAALASWNPAGEPGGLDAESLALLARTLDQETSRALRAVLLLAHAADPAADAVLLARLERRVAPADFAFPAVDVTRGGGAGARAAGAGDAARSAPPSSRSWRTAPAAHDDGRAAECAASALRLGRLGASAFLLGVLREGTPAREPRPRGARRDAHGGLAVVAVARAEALSERAGVRVGTAPKRPGRRARADALELEQILSARVPRVAARVTK
jgi:hypothetical protein